MLNGRPCCLPVDDKGAVLLPSVVHYAPDGGVLVGTAAYELKTATLVTREVALPPSCHDALSVVYALRAIALKAGDRITLPVADSGRIYHVQFAVTGRETIRSGIGPTNAWRIVPTIQQGQGRAEDSGIVLWVSDDARRAPVRIRVDLAVGSFNLVLKQASDS